VFVTAADGTLQDECPQDDRVGRAGCPSEGGEREDQPRLLTAG
jgi:hypothetical protein